MFFLSNIVLSLNLTDSTPFLSLYPITGGSFYGDVIPTRLVLSLIGIICVIFFFKDVKYSKRAIIMKKIISSTGIAN